MPDYLPFLLVALACPVTMGAIMWFMMKGMRGGHAGHGPSEQRAAQQAGPADLRTASSSSDRP
jgi:hypothetical protein